LVSFIVLSITYLAFGARTLFDVQFPDMMIRVPGVLTLISLPVFVFTAVKLRKER
jgi:hypothetical protein